MKALEKIGTFRDGSFKAWLYRIARNTVIDHYRTRKFSYSVEDAWDLPSGESIARDAEQRDQLERVRADLERFPSEQRDILLLRLWEGYSFAEIALIVGKSEGNCKVIVSRTLAKLRLESVAALLLLSTSSLFPFSSHP
jgi:RNA polymerase sigma-70 factor (ECF subfamily)